MEVTHMNAFPPYLLDGKSLSDTNRLKMLREDECEEAFHIETRAPQLVSLVRTLAGAEIQEAVEKVEPHEDSAREPVRCGEEDQVLSHG
jgi:hypothetical protein